jgi:ribosomal protein S18 acetylase RimI-like enzyme
MQNLLVRPYRPEDRSELFRIGADTANYGSPIEAYFDDRNLFLDSFYRYYTDYEPEHSWIAEVDGLVAGFLTGCTDTQRSERVMKKQLVPDVIRGLLRGKYHLGRKTLRYTARIALQAIRGEFTEVDLKMYPAHLHINVDERYRGLGLGRRLIEAYILQLQALRVPGVHLMTTSLNVTACILYEKMGFQLVDAHKTVFWDGKTQIPGENRAFARRVE